MNMRDKNGFDLNVFALTDIERNFGPDDTAWQFLKWNPEYWKAFRELSEIESNPAKLEAILGHIRDPQPEMIACAHDITCRQRFGIAAWLNPDCEQLPALKNSGDSWFFPLRRVDQRESALVLKRQGQSLGKPEMYPWLTVRETPFGYGSVITPGPNLPRPKGQEKKEHTPRFICVAFDCSIPLDGQLLAFEALARKHREYWNERIRSTNESTVSVASIG